MANTDITVSLANSIRFIENDGLLPHFGNTLLEDEDFHGTKIKSYAQKFLNGDTILVQIKIELSATTVLTRNNVDGTSAAVSLHDTNTYTDFKILDYLITVSTGDEFSLKATSETSEWESECIEVESELSGYLKIEWFNFDTPSANSNFEFDYTTTDAQAYVNLMYLDADLLTYKPGGESEIFDNQNEKVKIKENLFRKLTLRADTIPRYLAEKLIIAQAHDKFTVNDIEYVVEELPEPNAFGSTNFVEFNAELTQVAVLGLNTHDIGFDCDENSNDMIENKVEDNATSSGTFSISDGFGITQIIAKANSGSGITLKIGTSVGGEQVMYETEVGSSVLIDNNRYTPDISGAWTLYYTLAGTTPDIFLSIQTISFHQ